MSGSATTARAEKLPTTLLIGGTRVSTASGGTMDHVNPATGLVQATFPVAGPAEVDASVEAARRALQEFRTWSALERRLLMQRVAALLRSHSNEFARIAIAESGLPVSFASTLAEFAATWFDYYAGWTDKVLGHVYPTAAFNYTLREPYGVVAVLLTWNGPSAAIGMKVAPAFAAGCPVVLKSPELAPFSSNLFAELCVEAGAPNGAISVVAGGPETGEALVRHPGVDKISFTGGPTTARRIQALCADNLTPLVLELGGKSANLIFGDADLEAAAEHAAMGVIRLAGQVCHAPTRLLVEDTIYDAIVEAVCDRLRRVRVGDPTDPANEMGPLISERACTRVLAMIDEATQSGAGDLAVGGERVGDGLANGYFIQPTAFVGVDPASALAREEIFGPVLAITSFRHDDEAVELANDSPYGLAAHLHTRDLSRAHRVAAALDVGNVAVNGGMAAAGPVAPFGGVKDSGYGKEGGLEGLSEFLRTKNVNIVIS